MKKLSRRDFLGLVSVPVAAGTSGAIAAFVQRPPSEVAILPADSYAVDLEDVIGRGLDILRVQVRGARILLKPNMVEFMPGHAINTDPRVVVAAAAALLRRGAKSVIVGEGPAHRRDTEYLLDSTGLGSALRDDRLRFIDLNHDEVAWVALEGDRTRLGRIALPIEVLRADLVVSMPRLKTHHWAVLTASMKNLFGVVPGAVYGWPKNILHTRGIENAILDLTATLRPRLAIVDAVIGMEGDGPIMGSPRHVGCLVMGSDLPAVDATCARLMRLDPGRIGYLRHSGPLGNTAPRRIVQRAEAIQRYAAPFSVLPQFAGARLRSL